MPLSATIRLRLVTALLSAFLFGVLAGGSVAWVAAHRGFSHGPPSSRRPHGPPHGGPPRDRPDEMAAKMADKLCDDLQVDDTQRASIRQIFREGLDESEPLRQKMGEEMKAHFKRQNDRIRAQLTDDQKRRFDTLLETWEKEHGKEPPLPPRR